VEPLAANESQFLFDVSGLDRDLRVARFRAQEALSTPFSVELELVCEDEGLPFDQIVGQAARLTLRGIEGERYVTGMVSRFDQGESGVRFTTYHATLVPRVWLLFHRVGSRIFQDMSVPDIVAQVLEEGGFTMDDYRFVQQCKHTPRDYCVQYRESQLAFVMRLLEEEGFFFFFFEHQAEREVLVMADGEVVHEPVPGPLPLTYHPRTGQVPSAEFVYRFRYGEQVRPGSATLRDFKFKNPALNLEVSQSTDRDQDLEVYDYPGEYTTPEVGERLAQWRLEAQQTNRRRGSGESVCRRLLPGYELEMDGHPRPDFNAKWVLTRVDSFGNQPQVREEEAGPGGTEYSNRFECIPAGVPFRPPRVTRRPVIEGVQTAIVVGPAGEEIYTDEHGRVKVQFHWDRLGKRDQDSSCWVRVSQGWAGAGWGAMYLPRIGHEVMVDFIEGDPDRPLVVGRVYHGTNPPPYPLPKEKTKSTLKSNSSPGGGGYNELRFEDRKGSEEVYFQAEKDNNNLIKHDQSTNVGNDQTLTVGHDRTKTVKHDETVTVENDETITVNGKHTEAIKKDTTITVTQGNLSHTVSTGTATYTVKGAVSETFKDTQTTTVDKKIAVTSKTAQIHVTAATEIKLTTGDSELLMKKDGTIVLSGKDISIIGSATVNVSAPKVNVSGTEEVKAGVGTQNVTLNTAKVEVGGAGITESAVGVYEMSGAIIKLN
jgi:type VI secretion system secreted protein VgrG